MKAFIVSAVFTAALFTIWMVVGQAIGIPHGSPGSLAVSFCIGLVGAVVYGLLD